MECASEAISAKIEEIDISELIWHFDVPFLWKNGIYDLKPQEVIDSPDEHKEEYERVKQADLAYPIDIMWNKGRWLILDGLHRLMKASVLENQKIQVRKIPRGRIPDILK